MQISWLHLIPALALLLVPIAWFNTGVRHRAIHSEWRGYWKRFFTLPQHYVDLLRAAGGVFLLAHAVAPLPGAKGIWLFVPFLAVSAITLIAVALQALVCRERDSVHASFAFLIGLTLGFMPPLTAGATLVFALTITLGCRIAAVFYVSLAASAAIFGFVFIGANARYVVAPLVAGALLPWLAALLLHRELVITVRPRVVTGNHSPLRE